MNDQRSPRRFGKSEDRVTLRDLENLKELFAKDIFYITGGITEARRLVETLMSGFPLDYAKKLELEQTAQMVKDLKDRDLGEIKKMISLKLSTSDYDSKHEVLMEKYEMLKDKSRGWQSIEANINGRLWTLGLVVVGAFILLGYLFNYGLHLPPGVGK